MLIRFNPADAPAPASRYSQGVVAPAHWRWLHIAGQVGVTPDGQCREGYAAQIAQCFANIEAVLRGAGMTRADLVKLTVFSVPTDTGSIAAYRSERDAWLDGIAPAATFVGVTALASPDFLVEVEAIAAAA